MFKGQFLPNHWLPISSSDIQKNHITLHKTQMIRWSLRLFQQQVHVMLMQAQPTVGEPCCWTAAASVWKGYDRFSIELCEVDTD